MKRGVGSGGTKRSVLAAVLLVGLLPFPLFSQTAGETRRGESPPPIGGSLLGPQAPASAGTTRAWVYSHDFLKDAGQVWSYPAHVSRRDVIPLIALAASMAVLIPNDERIYAGFKDAHDDSAFVRHFSPVITQMGALGAWGTVGVFLGAGLVAKDSKAVETALLATSAMLQATLVSEVAKGLSGRQRPSFAAGEDHWSGPRGFFERYEASEASHFDSFPSGHASTAFSLATVIAMQYSDHLWVPIAAYTVATGVGLSRLTEDKHWLSDVVVGAALGHFIGRMVVRNHRLRHHIVPVLSVGPRSLTVAAAF